MIALLLAALVAVAAEVRLSVDVDRLEVGQTVGLEVAVVDGDPEGVPEVAVGHGLSVSYEGRSSERIIVNFRSTRTERFRYALTARREGSWTVGPARVVVDGAPLESGSVVVRVEPRSARPGGRTTRVSAELSDRTLWVGEVVLYRFRYAQLGRVLDARWTPPEAEGFVEDSLAEPARRDYVLTEDGRDWSVEEIELPLVAVSPGHHVVSPASVTVQLPARRRRGRWDDAFFGLAVPTRQETWSTDPIEVDVRPLPEEGRPADFSGLVGRFRVAVRPSAEEVALGDSVTLEITVEGTGRLAGLRLPPPPSDAGFRAYDDEPEVSAAIRDGAYVARAVFRRAIVPEREGELVVPPVRLSAFDPEKGAYVTLSSAPVRIRVRPGEGAGEVESFAGSGREDRREAVGALGEDVLPAPGGVRVGDRTLRSAWPWVGLFVAPPLLGLVGLGAGRVAARRRSDPWAALDRRTRALPADRAARLAELEAVARAAVGLRLGRPAPAVGRAEFASLGEEAAALYDALGAARYAGAEVADLEERVRRLLAEVRP